MLPPYFYAHPFPYRKPSVYRSVLARDMLGAGGLPPSCGDNESMTRARLSFDQSIRDGEELLAIYDALSRPKPEDGEVLKRAGLVLALTAWETYVEDVLLEVVLAKLSIVRGSHIASFMKSQLEGEIKRLHNPKSDKVKELFLKYLDLDIASSWLWAQFEPPRVAKTLDDLIVKRGDAVHRSKSSSLGSPPSAHLINRDELEKAIRFLKALVNATDSRIETSDGQ